MAVSRPDFPLACRLAQWTEGARNRLYRLVQASRRDTVVELGAGWGCVAEELSNRVNGHVIALDLDLEPLEGLRQRTGGRVQVIQADVHELPFSSGSVDLMVSHFAFLWFSDPARVLSEAARVLKPNGALALIEPDYGGLMEHPDRGLREEWIAGLQTHGADPFIGRRLPSLLNEHRFDSQVLFCDRYLPPDAIASDFLRPLMPVDRQTATAANLLSAPETLFLPLWLVAGFRPPSGSPIAFRPEERLR